MPVSTAFRRRRMDVTAHNLARDAGLIWKHRLYVGLAVDCSVGEMIV